jgi:hypothetical protein
LTKHAVDRIRNDRPTIWIIILYVKKHLNAYIPT